MQRSKFPVRSALLHLLVLAISFGLLVACDQDVEIKPEFSVNIFKPGPSWPNVKKLTPEQRQLFEKYGKPDCFHVYWTSDGAIQPRAELEKSMKGKKPKTIPPYSWVYLATNKEIVFPPGGKPREQPLPETVKIVAENGDPEDVRQDQPGVTQWMFFSTGKIYKIANNRVIEKKDFPALGKYLK
jgi:hypothetical protein